MILSMMYVDSDCDLVIFLLPLPLFWIFDYWKFYFVFNTVSVVL